MVSSSTLNFFILKQTFPTESIFIVLYIIKCQRLLGRGEVYKSSETLFREILCNYMIETVGNYNWYLL